MRSESPIRYSIVVPFFNEQENVPPLYMKLTEVMDSLGEPYELVFVDDGSRDAFDQRFAPELTRRGCFVASPSGARPPYRRSRF